MFVSGPSCDKVKRSVGSPRSEQMNPTKRDSSHNADGVKRVGELSTNSEKPAVVLPVCRNLSHEHCRRDEQPEMACNEVPHWSSHPEIGAEISWPPNGCSSQRIIANFATASDRGGRSRCEYCSPVAPPTGRASKSSPSSIVHSNPCRRRSDGTTVHLHRVATSAASAAFSVLK